MSDGPRPLPAARSPRGSVGSLGARVRGLRGWRATLLVLLAFTSLAAPLVVHGAVTNSEMSLFDEWQNADRVHEVTIGEPMVDAGEPITAWGHQQLACRGIARASVPDPVACAQDLPPTALDNPAANDPPTYFVVTGLGAAAITAVGITDDTLLAGRLVGVVWAVLSMYAVYWLAALLGARRAAAVLAASAVVLVPAFLQQYTYVTPHALGFTVGAFTVGATVKWLRAEWSWWPLLLAAASVAFVKSTNVVVVVALSVALAALIAWPSRSIDRALRLRALVGGLVLGVASLALTFLWTMIVGWRQVGVTSPPGNYTTAELPLQAVVQDSSAFLTRFGEGLLTVPSTWLVMAMSGSALAVWAGMVPWVRVELRPLAVGFLAGGALAPVVLDVMVFVFTDQYFGVAVRYALSLYALGLAFAALLLRTRIALVLAAVGLVSYAVLPGVLGLDAMAF